MLKSLRKPADEPAGFSFLQTDNFFEIEIANQFPVCLFMKKTVVIKTLTGTAKFLEQALGRL